MYNATKPELGPRFLWNLIPNRATIKGFLVFDYYDRFPEAMKDLTEWLLSGKIKYQENIIEGLENAPKFPSSIKLVNLNVAQFAIL